MKTIIDLALCGIHQAADQPLEPPSGPLRGIYRCRYSARPQRRVYRGRVGHYEGDLAVSLIMSGPWC